MIIITIMIMTMVMMIIFIDIITSDCNHTEVKLLPHCSHNMYGGHAFVPMSFIIFELILCGQAVIDVNWYT